MTHKDNEWFRGKPEVTGRYYWGGWLWRWLWQRVIHASGVTGW